MKRFLPSLLLVAWSCAPSPSDAPALPASDAVPSGNDAGPDAGPDDGSKHDASSPNDPSVRAADPFAPSVAGSGTAPSAPTSANDKLKLAHAFFDKGPGAVRDPNGDADVVSVFSPTATASQARVAVRGDPVPGYPGLYNVTLNNTGSGFQEMFLLQLPDVKPVTPVPLLVVFHRFGVSHADALFNTSFVNEARARGWYLVAPLAASQQNFACLEGQVNVEAALNFALSSFQIDRNRVYGVGFSMGGGLCTSYAARHLDPAGPMFAAIANHTGDVSLGHTYASESFAVQTILEGWYGGSPSTHAFNYQRCSAIDLDAVTGTIGAGTDMSRNLSSVPVLTWMASADPIAYLVAQTLAFESHIQAQNAGNTFTTVPAGVHSWSTLDDAAVCDFLAQRTLQTPSIASTLADRDGVYHRFVVEQDAANAFTPFSWSIDAAQNRMNLWATANLKRLTVDSSGLGLSFSGVLRLNLSSADGTGDDVLFLNVPYPPASVTRDGLAASGTFDPSAHTYLVHETSGAGHQWLLSF